MGVLCVTPTVYNSFNHSHWKYKCSQKHYMIECFVKKANIYDIQYHILYHAISFHQQSILLWTLYSLYYDNRVCHKQTY